MAENTQKLPVRLRGDSAECEEESDEDDVDVGCGEEGACDAAQSAEIVPLSTPELENFTLSACPEIAPVVGRQAGEGETSTT